MTRGSRWLAALCFALAVVPGLAAGQETGTALKADEIKAEPFKDARTLGKMAKGDALHILARKSGWLQVRVGTKTGWVRLLSVRRGQAGQASAAKEIGAVAGVATGRTGTGQVVSTTGVRGLDADELKAAKFDARQIAKVESLAVSAGEAKSFDAECTLVAQKIQWLPVPKGGSR